MIKQAGSCSTRCLNPTGLHIRWVQTVLTDAALGFPTQGSPHEPEWVPHDFQHGPVNMALMQAGYAHMLPCPIALLSSKLGHERHGRVYLPHYKLTQNGTRHPCHGIYGLQPRYSRQTIDMKHQDMVGTTLVRMSFSPFVGNKLVSQFSRKPRR